MDVTLLCVCKLRLEDTTDVFLHHRAEKYYIHQLINLCFEGPNTTFEYENFKMTVVKMDMMNAMEGGHVKISAPKVTFSYSIINKELNTM